MTAEGVPVLRDDATGAVYTDRDIERMRAELAADTGLDLSDMSAKSVVANHMASARRDGR